MFMKVSNNRVVSKLASIIFLLATLILGSLPIQGNAQVNYWVAPAASGAGDGSSSASPASYSNPTFWSSTVKPQLNSTNVLVNFESGSYNASLNFTNMGNPLYSLTLAAVTPQGSVFDPSSSYSYIVYLSGCQNIQLNGFIFTNNVAYWGVYCIPNGVLPCRNITINNCWFLNLTNAYYAAIGLLNGTRSIQVLNCNFTNIMDNNGNHQHIIYAPHDIEDVTVSNCIVQDCLADYMRFRDDSEYVCVENSRFISTMSSTAWPFVSAELYNETNGDSAGDEFFGTYFQVSSNSFTYEASGGPGPYSSMHFSDDSWSPDSYYCDLTSSQASQLASGNQSYQQSFLQTNMGIIGSEIKMFGNTYSGASTYLMDYQYLHDDSTAPYNDWTGVVNLYNTPDTSGASLGPPPVIRNGDFDKQGLLLTAINKGDDDYECLFRDWLCSPKYTDITNTPGFESTSNALRFDGTQNQYIYQWLTPPGPNWTMDFLFAIGTNFTGTGTKFRVDLIHNDIAGAKVSVGVNNLGQFGIYSGSTFAVLPGLGTIAFSVNTNANGNGNYTNPGDALNVYHMRIVGNYSAATPYVDLYTSDANSMTLDHEAAGNTSWVGSAPVSSQSSPETLVLYNYTAAAMVDQIAFTKGIPPAFNSTTRKLGKSLILSGTNGTVGETFYVLSTTNLAMPLANWTRVSTNTFSASNFSVTCPIPTNGLPAFYSLQLQ